MLAIELVGQLAGIRAISNAKSPRDVIAGARSITLVAGAGSVHNLRTEQVKMVAGGRNPLALLFAAVGLTALKPSSSH